MSQTVQYLKFEQQIARLNGIIERARLLYQTEHNTDMREIAQLCREYLSAIHDLGDVTDSQAILMVIEQAVMDNLEAVGLGMYLKRKRG